VAISPDRGKLFGWTRPVRNWRKCWNRCAGKSKLGKDRGISQQADGARTRGDLEAAQAIIAKALDLDKEDSRVRAAYAAVVQQVEEAARLAKDAGSCWIPHAARLEAGILPPAMKLLSDVEQIDPSNPELISLLKQAKSGQEQEQRRRVVEQLQNEISVATTHEQLTTAAARVNIALERMPNEPSLLKSRGNCPADPGLRGTARSG